MTSATYLTVLRVLLVPVFVILVLYGWLREALAVFMLAGLTDLMDGLIARRFNQRSQLGALLDPIADKLLLVSSFLVLSLPGLGMSPRMPIWLTVAVISRDVLLVTAVVIINLAVGRYFFPPSIYGKWTTTLQLLSVLLVLAGNALSISVPLIRPVFYLTLALTVFSGLHYLARGLKMIESENRKNE